MAREDAETLRRRLYAPGASEDDIARFRATGSQDGAPPRRSTELELQREPVEEPPAPPSAGRRPVRRRTVLLVAAAGLAVLAGVVVVGRLAAGNEPTAPPASPVAMSAADRNSLEHSLDEGNDAGIAAFLVTHDALRQLHHVTRATTLERRGTGDVIVPLFPVPAVADSGRATVLIVLAQPAEVRWTSLRTVDTTGVQRFVRQAERETLQEAGELTTYTFRYTNGNRPVDLRVDAPDGVRWGVAVVFTD